MELIVRATVIFFFLWFLTRAMGKRQLAEMTAFELILLVTLGDLVQQGTTQEDMSLTGALLAVGTIGFWTLVFSILSYRFKTARRTIDGVPVIIVRDGQLVHEALRMERLPVAEVLESARKQGIGNLDDVAVAVLEPDGRFSFIQKQEGDERKSGPGDDERHTA